MFCYNCGAKILDFAKFCPKCGTKQISIDDSNDISEKDMSKNPKSAELSKEKTRELSVISENSFDDAYDNEADDDEYCGYKTYPIGPFSITFDKNEVAYIECYRAFQMAVLNCRTEYIRFRKANIKEYDDFIQKALPTINQYVDSIINIGVETLLNYSIDYIDFANLKSALFEKYPIEKTVSELFDAQNKIDLYEQQLGIESSNKMRFQGGGFGITGAIKGAVQAEVLNLGMDALSGFGKWVTGNTDNDKIKRLKAKLYQKLISGADIRWLSIWCEGVFPLVYNVLLRTNKLDTVYFNEEMATAKFNNILKMSESNRYSIEQIVQSLLAGLKLYPFDINYCVALLNIIPNSRDDLVNFTDSCGTLRLFADGLSKYDEKQKMKQLEEEQKKKLNIISQYTNDPEILKTESLKYVAFNQGDLNNIVEKNKKAKKIYLIDNHDNNNKYEISVEDNFKSMHDVQYIGIGKVLVHIKSNTIIDFNVRKITFKNIDFDQKYKDLLQKHENFMQSSELLNTGLKYLDGGDYDKALIEFKKSRELGNGDASIFIGWIFENGLGVEKNSIAAKKLYDEGFSQGEHIAAYNLGAASKKGTKYAKINYDKAILWFSKCTDSVEALVDLADIYERGLGGKVNKDEAVKLYSKAYAMGSYKALYRYAVLSNKAPVEKKEMLMEAYHHGISEAIYNIGLLHSEQYKEAFSESENQGQKMAFECFGKAAVQGMPEAMYRLATAYLDGIGTEPSERLGVEYLKQSAEKGYVPAMVELGVCYANGTGIKKDYEKAINLYMLAANSGNNEAQFNLGICYQYGAGVKKDVKEAIYWYKLAMDNGNQDARGMIEKIKEDISNR